jgi:1,4-dihydroxy-2-naphthoyl-CoA hydrolase
MFAAEGINFDQVFHNGQFYVVIVHCEADYYAHLKVSDPLEIHVFCERIGRTSFTLLYQIYRQPHELVGLARTVHVTLGAESHQKIPLPNDLVALLTKIRAQ